jgi:phospholipase A1
VHFFLTHALSAEELSCTKIVVDKARLECYDATNQKLPETINESKQAADTPVQEQRSYLTRSWDLDNRDEDLLGEQQSPLRPHRGTYLIVRNSSQANASPSSPAHAAAATRSDIDLNEIKFQISQKAKVFNPVSMNIFGFTGFRMWGAYTQQSNWQAFNTSNSAPFRETNYEPELILTFKTGNQTGLKLLNLGYVHQSNGRDLSASRSWNRVYLQGGWESRTIAVLMRGWWRIPEGNTLDDNPDIEDYMGRGELKLRWEPLDGSQVVDLTLRNNFSSNPNRGFVQLDWATPMTISKSTKLHLQITSGYGESLIDYNFSQTTIGLGVSFRDW